MKDKPVRCGGSAYWEDRIANCENSDDVGDVVFEFMESIIKGHFGPWAIEPARLILAGIAKLDVDGEQPANQ